MNTLKTAYFHKGVRSAEVSQPVFNSNLGEQLTLEVYRGTPMRILPEPFIRMYVQGICDGADGNDNWSNLSVVNAKTMAVEEYISAPGIYYVGIPGVSKIRTQIVDMSGEFTVFGSIQG